MPQATDITYHTDVHESGNVYQKLTFKRRALTNDRKNTLENAFHSEYKNVIGSSTFDESKLTFEFVELRRRLSMSQRILLQIYEHTVNIRYINDASDVDTPEPTKSPPDSSSSDEEDGHHHAGGAENSIWLILLVVGVVIGAFCIVICILFIIVCLRNTDYGSGTPSMSITPPQENIGNHYRGSGRTMHRHVQVPYVV